MPPARRAPGPARATYLHTPLADERARAADARSSTALETVDASRASRCSSPRVAWPQHVDGVSNLAHKIVDLTDCRALVAARRDGRARLLRRPQPHARARRGRGRAAPSAAAATRRRRRRSSAAALDEARRALLASALAAARREPARRARSCPARPARSRPDETGRRTRWSLCQRHAPERDPRRRGRPPGRRRSRARISTRRSRHGLSHAPVKGIMSSRVATVRPRTRRSPSSSGCSSGSADGRVAVAPRRPASSASSRAATCCARSASRPRPSAEPGAEPRPPSSRGSSGCSRPSRRSPRSASPTTASTSSAGPSATSCSASASFDVDIAVEGDAIALAGALADGARRPRPPAREVRHGGRRSTATASGSTSSPPAPSSTTRPAALPTVEHATIREDLFRRDFTINAMAVSLKGEDFGRLVDPFGGRRDLEAGTIRVLHNLSFIDDPTRIFRAIRYENRYGFRMDEHTRAARARLHRDGARRRPLVGAASRRARRAARGGRRRALDPPARRARRGAARSIRTSPPTRRPSRLLDRLRRAARASYGLERPRLAARARSALARRLPPDELYALARPAQGAPPRRRADRRRGHGRPADRRAAARPAGSSRRRSSRSPSRTRPTRRSSRWRSTT